MVDDAYAKQEDVMRTIVSCLIGIGLVWCVAAGQETQSDGPSQNVKSEVDSKIYAMTYRLKELPVWSSDGEFDPTVLISLIQSSVAPTSWEASGGASTMAPYTQNASLVVATTSANHDELQILLERLRKSIARKTVVDDGEP